MFDSPLTEKDREAARQSGSESLRTAVSHAYYGRRVQVLPHPYLPIWLQRIFCRNIGRIGKVTYVEVGEATRKAIMTVAFENSSRRDWGYYFEDQLKLFTGPAKMVK